VNAPDDLCFAKSHEWLRLEGSTATVGISDHAQQELTDIVYVELPEVGAEAGAGETICVVESVKTASDIYAPISGKVTAVNDALTKNPGLVNSDPYGEGWIFKLEVAQGCEDSDLLSAADYRALVGEH
jgi:glycine cleavage system H protein